MFDLEFFQNKIGSSAYTVATVEKHVLSGLPFWEDGNDAIIDMDSESDNESKQLSKESLKDIGYKNTLAQKVVEKMAEEKKQKLMLIQDLENIKDKFTELSTVMKKLELFEDLA